MSPTALGMRAVGDPSLIRQIERGRSPSLRTADRVLAYIAAYDRDSAGGQHPEPCRGRRRSFSGTEGPRAKGEEPIEPNTGPPARILRYREVEARTGLSRSTIYRWQAAGRFPAAVVLGRRTVGWIESDVDAWIRKRAEESRGGGEAAAC